MAYSCVPITFVVLRLVSCQTVAYSARALTLLNLKVWNDDVAQCSVS